MPHALVLRRRVQFYETDAAGIVHFSTFFRYLEEAEHALWRANGMSIFTADPTHGWPRVAAAFDYKRPLRFQDEFVVLVRIIAVSRRTIRYGFELRRDDTFVGHGSITVASVTVSAAGEMTSVDVPIGIVERLRGAMNGPPVEE